MATTNNTKSTWTGDGSTKSFVILCGPNLLTGSHMTVTIDGGAAKTFGTDFSVSSDLLSVVFSDAHGAPASAAAVVLLRTTPHPTPYVAFADEEVVTAQNLDDSIRQCLFYGEEVEDIANGYA